MATRGLGRPVSNAVHSGRRKSTKRMRNIRSMCRDIDRWDSNSRSKVCVKYAGPMELWNDAPVTPYESQSGRRLSHLRLSANTVMLRTACFLCVIGHRELLPVGCQQGPNSGQQD